MPTFTITSPDGATYTANVPEGVSEQDVLAQVQAQHAYHQQRLAQADAAVQAEANTNPTADSSFGQNLVEGAGKTITDIGRGAKQYGLGIADIFSPRPATAPSRVDEYRQQVAQQRQSDAPLMNTAGGKVGGIVGGALVTAPAMLVPGANTVAGAGLTGAVYGALQPSTSTQETLTNIGVGGATGAVGQYAGQKVGSAITQKLASRTAAAADEQSVNAARDTVLKASQKAGYVVPPTAVNPSMKATALESVAGKAAVRQQADAINQKVTNGLIAQDLGVPKNVPLTRELLQGIRSKAGQIYAQIRGLGSIPSDAQYTQDMQTILGAGKDLEQAYPGIGSQVGEKVQGLVQSLSVPAHDANGAVSAFRYLNEQAKRNYTAAFAEGGNSQALELAKAQSAAADAIGDLIQRNLAQSGQGDLATAWQQARTTIAKTYQIGNALKGNNVNAGYLAQQLRKDKPLTGAMKIVADFADQFGEVTRLPKSGVGVTKLGAAIAGTGAAGALATGYPMLAAGLVAAPVVSYGVKNALLSRAGQASLASPSYVPSLTGTAGLNAIRYLGRGAVPLALPATNALVPASR